MLCKSPFRWSANRFWLKSPCQFGAWLLLLEVACPVRLRRQVHVRGKVSTLALERVCVADLRGRTSPCDPMPYPCLLVIEPLGGGSQLAIHLGCRLLLTNGRWRSGNQSSLTCMHGSRRCTYIHIHTCKQTYIHSYIHTHTYINTYTHKQIHIIHVCMHVCMYVFM